MQLTMKVDSGNLRRILNENSRKIFTVERDGDEIKILEFLPKEWVSFFQKSNIDGFFIGEIDAMRAPYYFKGKISEVENSNEPRDVDHQIKNILLNVIDAVIKDAEKEERDNSQYVPALERLDSWLEKL